MADETQQVEESKIRLLSRKELLIQFHNAHMRQFIADMINLGTFSKLKDDEVFAVVPVRAPGTNEVTNRKVMIREQKAVVTQQLNQQTQLLQTMEELLKNEGVEIPAEAMLPVAGTDKEVQVMAKS
jgi:hypothetical protein